MASLVYCNDKNCLTNNYCFALSTIPASNPTQLPRSHTGIADSGASGFYFAPGVPVSNLYHKAPTVGVRVVNGLPERSVASANLASAPSLPPAAMQGHVMPTFPHALISLGPFADLGARLFSPRQPCLSSIPMGTASSKVGVNSTVPASGDSHSTPPSQVCQ